MIKKNFLFIILLSLATGLFAQDKDFEIWTEAGVEKRLNKKFSIYAVEEFRFDKNASSFDKWHTTIGTHYVVNKSLKFRLFYRYTLNNTLTKGYLKSNRVAADGIFTYRYERFIFRYRLRYQHDFINAEGLQTDGQYLRNRLGVKYNIRKTPLMPYINYETTHYLSGDGVTLDRHRITGGLSYDFTDYFKSSIYYRYQTSDYKIFRQQAYILGFSVGFEF